MSDNSDRSKGFSHPTPEEMGVSPEAAAHANRAAWYINTISDAITFVATLIYLIVKVVQASPLIILILWRRAIQNWRNWRGGRTAALTPLGPRAQRDDRELGIWVGASFGFMLVVATAALAWAAFSKGTDPPEAPTDLEVIVAQDGDNYFDLAVGLGIPWEDLVEANLPLVDENTAWCLARDMTDAYYRGMTASGRERNTDFCVLSTFGGKRRAIATLRPGQHVTVPYRDGSVSGEEASMALTDQ